MHTYVLSHLAFGFSFLTPQMQFREYCYGSILETFGKVMKEKVACGFSAGRGDWNERVKPVFF